MADRLRAHLPRVALFVLLGLAATATLTYAAGRQLGSPSSSSTTTTAPDPPLVVPNVKSQAFVFAKGQLEDAGFAWKVLGSVHGFAANIVVAQSPAPGTRVLDTGAPLVTLSLKRNAGYTEKGVAEDVSPYQASVIAPADLAAAVGPAHPATTPVPKTTTTAPAATTTTTAPKTATTTTAPKTATTQTTTTPATPKTTTTAAAASPKKPAWPTNRPPAFTVPGGRKEPLDEMPLTDRAAALARWLDAHPKKTDTNVKHWLYQNAWIVTGAKLGWWHGAEALTTLIAADRRAQQLWGIGSKSALQAQSALGVVESKSK